MLKTITGGCHCGQVSYRAKVDDQTVMVCHCEDCQVLSGSVYRSIVKVEEANFHITGELTNYVKVAASGNRRVQAFCPQCGTHIYAASADDDSPKVYNLRAGTSSQRKELVPMMEIWCDSAIAWNPPLQGTQKIARQS